MCEPKRTNLRNSTRLARVADLGAEPMPMTPAGIEKIITEEIENWAKVIRFAAIKPI
jgi:hypothetical protein